MSVQSSMKIASFNVNSLRARLPVVVKWLDEQKPDILCVQETKVQDIDFPAGELDGTGYNYAFRGQKSYNGVAILSRGKIENVRFGLGSEPADESRLVTAKIAGISIVNTYVPQGYLADSEKFEYKLKWFGRLKKFFERHFKPDEPVVWVGDLNVAPEPMDVYDPVGLLDNVCFHPDARRALKEVVEWGFVDVFRMHCDKPGQYTFWDYRLRDSVSRNLGWRLDHIMATKPLAEKCTGCQIDKDPRLAERPSDHTPIIAEFDWQ